MERVFTRQGDNHLFVWVFCLQGELILADCAILLKKGGWKRVEHSESERQVGHAQPSSSTSRSNLSSTSSVAGTGR
jgi:hypothetical protein